MGEINKNGQIELNFESDESAKTLNRVLSEIIVSYPLIEKIIEGRISYDGKFFYIDNKKDKRMIEDELKSFMEGINKFEVDKLSEQKEIKRKEEEEYRKKHPIYSWQRRKDFR